MRHARILYAFLGFCGLTQLNCGPADTFSSAAPADNFETLFRSPSLVTARGHVRSFTGFRGNDVITGDEIIKEVLTFYDPTDASPAALDRLVAYWDKFTRFEASYGVGPGDIEVLNGMPTILYLMKVAHTLKVYGSGEIPWALESISDQAFAWYFWEMLISRWLLHESEVPKIPVGFPTFVSGFMLGDEVYAKDLRVKFANLITSWRICRNLLRQPPPGSKRAATSEEFAAHIIQWVKNNLAYSVARTSQEVDLVNASNNIDTIITSHESGARDKMMATSIQYLLGAAGIPVVKFFKEEDVLQLDMHLYMPGAERYILPAAVSRFPALPSRYALMPLWVIAEGSTQPTPYLVRYLGPSSTLWKTIVTGVRYPKIEDSYLTVWFTDIVMEPRITSTEVEKLRAEFPSFNLMVNDDFHLRSGHVTLKTAFELGEPSAKLW